MIQARRSYGARYTVLIVSRKRFKKKSSCTRLRDKKFCTVQIIVSLTPWRALVAAEFVYGDVCLNANRRPRVQDTGENRWNRQKTWTPPCSKRQTSGSRRLALSSMDYFQMNVFQLSSLEVVAEERFLPCVPSWRSCSSAPVLLAFCAATAALAFRLTSTSSRATFVKARVASCSARLGSHLCTH